MKSTTKKRLRKCEAARSSSELLASDTKAREMFHLKSLGGGVMNLDDAGNWADGSCVVINSFSSAEQLSPETIRALEELAPQEVPTMSRVAALIHASEQRIRGWFTRSQKYGA